MSSKDTGGRGSAFKFRHPKTQLDGESHGGDYDVAQGAEQWKNMGTDRWAAFWSSWCVWNFWAQCSLLYAFKLFAEGTNDDP